MTVSRQGILAYFASGVAFHMIASAFNFYYVKVYFNVFHIEESWFQAAQVLHLIWNAINNPLFAYVQDRTNVIITKPRRKCILYCGPLFALSFTFPWIQWGNGSWFVGLQLIVALFLWDTMFTFVGLALSALFTELSQSIEDRVMLTRYAQIASIFGGPSVLLLEFTSDSLNDFKAFKITAVLISCCSMLLFIYTGHNAHTEYDLKEKKDDDNNAKKKVLEESYMKQVGQIVFDKNFVAFNVTYFCHGFHKTFLNSFTAIICDQLISDKDIPKNLRKIFYGGMSLMSTIVIICGASLVTRYSYYYVIRSAFIFMTVAGVVMLHIGQGHPWCFMTFLLADNCAAGATFSLFNMPQADIADDNKIRYNRTHPISSTVFGISALVSKPALALSPMFAVYILNSYGYSELTKKDIEASPELKHVMFLLVCLYPVVIGSLQFIAWCLFDIQYKSDKENVI